MTFTQISITADNTDCTKKKNTSMLADIYFMSIIKKRQYAYSLASNSCIFAGAAILLDAVMQCTI